MPYRLVPVPPDQLRDLANAVPPASLAFATEDASLPPDFVARASLELLEAHPGLEWCTTFYILREDDDTIVGSLCFKSPPVGGAVEIGYGVAVTARGQGAARQAVAACVEIAFRQGLRQVNAEVEIGNLASERVLQAAGFEQVGTRDDDEDGTVGIWARTRTETSMDPTLPPPLALATGAWPKDADRVLEVLSRTLQPGVVQGVYLYGSCVASRLRHQSDLDLLVLVAEPIVGPARQALVAELLRISGWQAVDDSSRPLDLTFVCASEIQPWRHPARCELLFGEWLRAELMSGRVAPPALRPDLAIQMSTVLQDSLALVGRPAREVFDPVPRADLDAAMRACLPDLVRHFPGDERNVLLTVARIWATQVSGRILPKDQAAQWVMARMPAPLAGILALARSAYLGEQRDDWPAVDELARAALAHMVEQLQREGEGAHRGGLHQGGGDVAG